MSDKVFVPLITVLIFAAICVGSVVIYNAIEKSNQAERKKRTEAIEICVKIDQCKLTVDDLLYYKTKGANDE